MRFDDYTDVACRVVEEANETARTDGHSHLSAEQVLLTLLDTAESQAANVLSRLSTDTAALRAAVFGEVKQVPRVRDQSRIVIESSLVRIFDLVFHVV